MSKGLGTGRGRDGCDRRRGPEEDQSPGNTLRTVEAGGKPYGPGPGQSQSWARRRRVPNGRQPSSSGSAARDRERGGVAKDPRPRAWLLGGVRVSVGPRTIGEEEWRLKQAGSPLKLLAVPEEEPTEDTKPPVPQIGSSRRRVRLLRVSEEPLIVGYPVFENANLLGYSPRSPGALDEAFLPRFYRKQ